MMLWVLGGLGFVVAIGCAKIVLEGKSARSGRDREQGSGDG